MDGFHVAVLVAVVLIVVACIYLRKGRRGAVQPRSILYGSHGCKRFWTMPWRQGTYVEELSQSLSRADYERWQCLLKMSRGDKEQAKRLVLLEQSRRTGVTIEDSLQYAIRRWKRDIC
ncbi:MAG: hypothetical protein EA399_05870 [Desulfovibrionales bacterium]|nr:MAG: hypothetical protein EA399_05870 [Desulfovibrionales bacterium]